MHPVHLCLCPQCSRMPSMELTLTKGETRTMPLVQFEENGCLKCNQGTAVWFQKYSEVTKSCNGLGRFCGGVCEPGLE